MCGCIVSWSLLCNLIFFYIDLLFTLVNHNFNYNLISYDCNIKTITIKSQLKKAIKYNKFIPKIVKLRTFLYLVVFMNIQQYISVYSYILGYYVI